MSRVICIFSSPAASAPRSFGSRPIPTGSSANGVRLPNSLSRTTCTWLTGVPLTSCLPSVNRIRAGRVGVGGEVLGSLLHRRDVVRVDADLLDQFRVEPLPVCRPRRCAGSRRTCRPSPGCSGDAGRRSPGCRSPSPRIGPWLAVVSPATRSAEVSSTRAAIRSRAVAKRSRLALSFRIDAEKSSTRTTSDLSGVAARAVVVRAPPDSRAPTTIATTMRLTGPRRFIPSLLSRRSESGVTCGVVPDPQRDPIIPLQASDPSQRGPETRRSDGRPRAATLMPEIARHGTHPVLDACRRHHAPASFPP